MTPFTVLDYLIFQLTPTRTRFDLYIVAGCVSERLTSGLLKPFLCHLQTVEAQFATGGYSIKLEPQPDCISKDSWFTKDIVERFVRFVNMPDMIERVNTIEVELAQLEKMQQAFTPTRANAHSHSFDSSQPIHGDRCLFSSAEKPGFSSKIGQDPASDATPGKNSKVELRKALDARRLVLQKEQGMAFARGAAAGLELVQLLQLIVFGEYFQAIRLKEACIMYVTLAHKRHIAGFSSDEVSSVDNVLVLAAASAGCNIVKATSENNLLRSQHGELKHESDILLGKGTTVEPSLNHRHRHGHGQQNSSPSSGQGCHHGATAKEWSKVYTADNNNSGGTFQVYQHGFSPCSQESFNILSDMSPPGFFHPFTGGIMQSSPSPDAHHMLYTYDHHHPAPSEGKSNTTQQGFIPPMRLPASNRHGRCIHPPPYKQHLPKQGTDDEEEESMADDYDKESAEVTDSSSSQVAASSSKPHAATMHPPYARESYGRTVELSLLGRSFSNIHGATRTKVVDQSIAQQRLQSGGRWSHSENGTGFSFAPKEGERRMSSTINNDSSSSSSSSLLLHFDEGEDDGLNSKRSMLKKRLEFHEQEKATAAVSLGLHGSSRRQQVAAVGKEAMPVDMDAFSRGPKKDQDSLGRLVVQSELTQQEGNRIFDMMSKKALMVNTATEPDIDLMMHRQQRGMSSRSGRNADGDDDMRIDAELQKKQTQAPNAATKVSGAATAQERVKKFVDQYNEKRDAKLKKGGTKMTTTTRDSAPQKRKKAAAAEMGARRPVADRLPHHHAAAASEAQVRADKVRAYKAALQKSKREQEDEERKRLQALKAQRQERIAARRLVAAHSFGAAKHSSFSQPKTSSLLPKHDAPFLQKAKSFPLRQLQRVPSKPKESPKPSELRSSKQNGTADQGGRGNKDDARRSRNSVRPSHPKQTNKMKISRQGTTAAGTQHHPISVDSSADAAAIARQPSTQRTLLLQTSTCTKESASMDGSRRRSKTDGGASTEEQMMPVKAADIAVKRHADDDDDCRRNKQTVAVNNNSTTTILSRSPRPCSTSSTTRLAHGGDKFQPCFSFSNAVIVSSSLSAADQTVASLAHLSSQTNDSSSERLAQNRNSITTGLADDQATAGFSFFDRCCSQNGESCPGKMSSISSISVSLSVVSPDRSTTTSRIKPSGDPCVASSPDSFIAHRKHSSVSESAIFASGETSIRDDHTKGLKRLLGFGRRSESSSAADCDGRGKTEKNGEGETCANNKNKEQQRPPNNRSDRRRQSASGSSKEWQRGRSAKPPQSYTSSSCSQKPIITKLSSSSSPSADSGKGGNIVTIIIVTYLRTYSLVTIMNGAFSLCSINIKLILPSYMAPSSCVMLKVLDRSIIHDGQNSFHSHLLLHIPS